MYTSGLVPRRMALSGLIGGPLLIASGIAVLFDVFQQGGPGQSIATIPEFLWELSLGIYLTVKGSSHLPSSTQLARELDATFPLAQVDLVAQSVVLNQRVADQSSGSRREN